MKNNKLYAAIGVIFVVFSVMAFVVPFPKDSFTFWVAYFAEVVAITAQLVFAQRAFDGDTALKSKVYGFPIFRIGYFYLGVQTSVSLIFMILAWIMDKNDVLLPNWIAPVVCVIIIGAAALGLIAVEMAREKIVLVEQKLSDETELMRNLRTGAQNLVSKANSPELKQALEKLAENIRYSDPVSKPAIASYDMALTSSFDALRNAVISGNAAAALELAKQTQTALDDRNNAAKMNK